MSYIFDCPNHGRQEIAAVPYVERAVAWVDEQGDVIDSQKDSQPWEIDYTKAKCLECQAPLKVTEET